MKRIALFLFLILSSITCFAQTQIDPTYQIQWSLLSGSGAPTISCTQNGNYTVYPYGAEWGQSYTDTSTNPKTEYKCTPHGWDSGLTAGIFVAGAANPTIIGPGQGVSIYFYGAKCDWNSTTQTGTDDSAALQTAVLASAYLSPVIIPATGASGGCFINTEVEMPSGTTIVGYGQQSKIIFGGKCATGFSGAQCTGGSGNFSTGVGQHYAPIAARSQGFLLTGAVLNGTTTLTYANAYGCVQNCGVPSLASGLYLQQPFAINNIPNGATISSINMGTKTITMSLAATGSQSGTMVNAVVPVRDIQLFNFAINESLAGEINNNWASGLITDGVSNVTVDNIQFHSGGPSYWTFANNFARYALSGKSKITNSTFFTEYNMSSRLQIENQSQNMLVSNDVFEGSAYQAIDLEATYSLYGQGLCLSGNITIPADCSTYPPTMQIGDSPDFALTDAGILVSNVTVASSGEAAVAVDYCPGCIVNAVTSTNAGSNQDGRQNAFEWYGGSPVFTNNIVTSCPYCFNGFNINGGATNGVLSNNYVYAQSQEGGSFVADIHLDNTQAAIGPFTLTGNVLLDTPQWSDTTLYQRENRTGYGYLNIYGIDGGGHQWLWDTGGLVFTAFDIEKNYIAANFGASSSWRLGEDPSGHYNVLSFNNTNVLASNIGIHGSTYDNNLYLDSQGSILPDAPIVSPYPINNSQSVTFALQAGAGTGAALSGTHNGCYDQNSKIYTCTPNYGAIEFSTGTTTAAGEIVRTTWTTGLGHLAVCAGLQVVDATASTNVTSNFYTSLGSGAVVNGQGWALAAYAAPTASHSYIVTYTCN